MKPKLKTLCCSLALAALVPTSYAQVGGMGAGMGGAMGAHKGREGRGPNAGRPSEAPAPGLTRLDQLNDRLAGLRGRLLLTPEQAPLFENFATRVMEHFMVGQGPAIAPAAQMTAIESVQQRLTLEQNRYAAWEDVADAAGKLYRSLSPAQQKTADQFLPQAILEVERQPLMRPARVEAGSGPATMREKQMP